MNRVFKTLLLWLLAIAIPMQGIAAATKTSCGSNHRAMMATYAVGGSIDHEAPNPQLHHDHELYASAILIVDSESNSAKSTYVAHTDCGTCSACCIGSLVPLPETDRGPLPSYAALAIPREVLPLGFIPAGPERPPRIIFA